MNLAEVRWVGLNSSAIGVGEFIRRIGVANRAEDDLLSVGRIRRFGVVPETGRQSPQLGPIAPCRKDLHLFVVIPRITPLLAGGTELQLRFLFRQGLRIVM